MTERGRTRTGGGDGALAVLIGTFEGVLRRSHRHRDGRRQAGVRAAGALIPSRVGTPSALEAAAAVVAGEASGGLGLPRRRAAAAPGTTASRAGVWGCSSSWDASARGPFHDQFRSFMMAISP